MGRHDNEVVPNRVGYSLMTNGGHHGEYGWPRLVGMDPHFGEGIGTVRMDVWTPSSDGRASNYLVPLVTFHTQISISEVLDRNKQVRSDGRSLSRRRCRRARCLGIQRTPQTNLVSRAVSAIDADADADAG